MKKSLPVVLTLTLVLAVILSSSALALADFPMGAVNRTVQVTTGMNPGTYLVHEGFRNGDYATNNRENVTKARQSIYARSHRF